jgi:hypothetical protein
MPNGTDLSQTAGSRWRPTWAGRNPTAAKASRRRGVSIGAVVVVEAVADVGGATKVRRNTEVGRNRRPKFRFPSRAK